jgi:hypothetical protein
MSALRNLFMLFAAVSLACCSGGDSGSQSTDGTPDGYTVSYPLVDNSGANAYKVLLMGNSHAAGLRAVLAELLALGQPGKSIEVRLSPGSAFLDERVNDGSSEQALESEPWTHVILQGQKYSSSGAYTYPTDAAEYWIRGSKLQRATPILFPEHPRAGNTWEGQRLWELHSEIAMRENTCVAPVGLVWDQVKFRVPSLVLHQPDGNHAAGTGALLTALVFYPIITGQPLESLPELSTFGIDAATEQVMKESVASILYAYAPCDFEE